MLPAQLQLCILLYCRLSQLRQPSWQQTNQVFAVVTFGGFGVFWHCCKTTTKRGRLEAEKVKLHFHSHSQPAFVQKHGRVCPSAPRATDRAAPSAHTQHLPAVQEQAWERGQSKQPQAAGRHGVWQGQQLVTGLPSSLTGQLKEICHALPVLIYTSKHSES